MRHDVKSILVTGASGQLGGYVVREMTRAGRRVVAWSNTWRGEIAGVPAQRVDLIDRDAVAKAFDEISPAIEAVVHAGAVSSTAVALREPTMTHAINVQATAQLCELAAKRNAKLIYLSTDLVFDGTKGSYTENDQPRPLSAYARSKLEGEQAVMAMKRGLVMRVALLFGPTLTGRAKFFEHLVSSLREGRSIALFHDEWRTPLSVLTAARAIALAASSDVTGLLHVGGPQRMSRSQMGQRLAKVLGVDASCIEPVSRLTGQTDEPRPADCSLDSSRWREMFGHCDWPTYEKALAQLT